MVTLTLAEVTLATVASVAVPWASPSRLTVSVPLGGVAPGSAEVTVPVTVMTWPPEGVVVEGKIYFNPTMIQKQCPRIWVRVRPDGPGPDVEAYSGGEHIGTLYHKDDHPNMQAGNNSACKAFINRSRAENEKRNRRSHRHSQAA